jgi:hypothetical protein
MEELFQNQLRGRPHGNKMKMAEILAGFASHRWESNLRRISPPDTSKPLFCLLILSRRHDRRRPFAPRHHRVRHAAKHGTETRKVAVVRWWASMEDRRHETPMQITVPGTVRLPSEIKPWSSCRSGFYPNTWHKKRVVSRADAPFHERIAPAPEPRTIGRGRLAMG